MIADELPTSGHASHMTIAIPVCKRGTSTTIARSLRNRLLNTATRPTTAIAKDENILDVTDATELSHLLPKAVVAQEELLQAMQMVCCEYTEYL